MEGNSRAPRAHAGLECSALSADTQDVSHHVVKLLRSLPLAVCVAVVLVSAPVGAQRTQSKSGSTAMPDAAAMKELRGLLEQAEKLQDQQALDGKTAAGDGTGKTGSAKAVDGEATPAAKPTPVVQAGCMYSGTKLIWEKVAGTCTK